MPQDQFVAAWNQAGSLAEAAERLKELAGGNVPRWAAMARAMSLRKDGWVLKMLTPVTVNTPVVPECDGL